MLVIDVSGSMGEEVGNGETKLDLAKRASVDALAEFKPEDLVGLRIFSTNISPNANRTTTSTSCRSLRSLRTAK